MSDLDLKTKKELESIAREYNVELDGKPSKKVLLKHLKAVIGEQSDSAEEADYVASSGSEEALQGSTARSEPAEEVFIEVNPSTPSPSAEFLTKRTKPSTLVNRYFADANNQTLKFATLGPARSTAHRFGGKAIAIDNYFIVRKY
jgi:hypothetical protein